MFPQGQGIPQMGTSYFQEHLFYKDKKELRQLEGKRRISSLTVLLKGQTALILGLPI